MLQKLIPEIHTASRLPWRRPSCSKAEEAKTLVHCPTCTRFFILRCMHRFVCGQYEGHFLFHSLCQLFIQCKPQTHVLYLLASDTSNSVLFAPKSLTPQNPSPSRSRMI
ncbi:uncharacterized protein VTP21DRAFT_4403 [Calcarisporiella thermophila]|uniref:uncharacterized protein n=1 Tax=Calcarisporiella thermophila TaxID=911321 RepID=UPI003743390C